MSIEFDANGCLAELRRQLVGALMQLREEFMNEAISHMSTPEGREDLHPEVIEATVDAVAVTVIAGPWAVMDEWGKGSLLDETNPALLDYIDSEYWNSLRDRYDFTVVGRPPSKYLNIFGERIETRGTLAGVNLERLAFEGELPYSFLPNPPSHALQTAARWLRNGRVREVILGVLGTFDWGRFLVVRRR